MLQTTMVQTTCRTETTAEFSNARPMPRSVNRSSPPRAGHAAGYDGRPWPLSVADAWHTVQLRRPRRGVSDGGTEWFLEQNVENIGVEFDHVVSAQQLGAYKPKAEAFLEAWKRMGAEPGEVVHVAQGWEYDIMPTFPLGVSRRVWINRGGLPGSDAFQPYDELRDLAGLPELLREA
jgi:2-haloacid dehalogenase